MNQPAWLAICGPEDGDDQGDEEDAGGKPVGAEEPAAPPEEAGDNDETEQGGADGDHEVVGLEDGVDLGPVGGSDLGEFFLGRVGVAIEEEFVGREVIEAGDGRFEIVEGEEAEETGNFRAGGGAFGGVDPTEEGHGGVVGGLENAFHGGEFDRLVGGNALGGDATAENLEAGRDGGEGEADLHGRPGEGVVAAAEDVVGADTDDEESSGHPASEDDVGESVDGRGVEDHGPEVGHDGADAAEVGLGDDVADGENLGSAGGILDFEVKSGRGLHPGVGDHDPDGTEVGSGADHAGGEEVEARADFVPTKEEEGEEAGLEKKRKNALGGEGATENVADEAGVGRPVRAEFELHDDAGGHADGEGEREDAGPIARHVVVKRVAGFQPDSFHDHQRHPEADGQRRVDVMEHDREGELHACQNLDVHGVNRRRGFSKSYKFF